MSRPKLIDVFPGAFTGNGIFDALDEQDVPWKDDNIASDLDFEYYGNISGEKKISPLIDKIKTGDTLTAEQIEKLASICVTMFGLNWSKQWATLSFEYNPINNYDMVENMTNDETVIEYGRTHTKTGTETQTPDITEETTPDLENTQENDVRGFNSSDDVPTGKSTTTATGTNTVTRTGTDEMEYNTTDADTGEDTHTRNYELTRSGNIGVTTSQMMIQSERDLWKWTFFYTVVFPDIDRVLTIQIY